MISMVMPTRRSPAVARLGVVVLVAFAVASLVLAAPPGAAAADPNEPRDSATATTISDLNLRIGTSLDSAVLLVMPAGSIVDSAGEPKNDFYPVRFEGVSGYAHGAYLDFGSGPVADPPPPPPAPAPTDIVGIIYAAADAYGQPREDMLRVAQCESGLDPNQVTPPYSASGLFQFLPSTWATTPYADQNIFDPVASANAAAWMWSVGRRGEWVCQ